MPIGFIWQTFLETPLVNFLLLLTTLSFEIKTEIDGPRQTRLLMTELIKQDKSSVDISYVCRRFAEGWREGVREPTSGRVDLAP